MKFLLGLHGYQYTLTQLPTLRSWVAELSTGYYGILSRPGVVVMTVYITHSLPLLISTDADSSLVFACQHQSILHRACCVNINAMILLKIPHLSEGNIVLLMSHTHACTCAQHTYIHTHTHTHTPCIAPGIRLDITIRRGTSQ